MTSPTKSAAEWAEMCRVHRAVPMTGLAVSLCLNCADAYAHQQVEAHQAVVRELAQLLTNACTMRQNGGFVGDNIDRWLTNVNILLAHPLIQQAREEK